jgi:hypothetical protein
MTTTSTSITAVSADGDQNEEDNNSSSSNNSVIGDDDVNAPRANRTTAKSTEMIMSNIHNVVSRPPPPLRFIEIDPNARYGVL